VSKPPQSKRFLALVTASWAVLFSSLFFLLTASLHTVRSSHCGPPSRRPSRGRGLAQATETSPIPLRRSCAELRRTRSLRGKARRDTSSRTRLYGPPASSARGPEVCARSCLCSAGEVLASWVKCSIDSTGETAGREVFMVRELFAYMPQDQGFRDDLQPAMTKAGGGRRTRIVASLLLASHIVEVGGGQGWCVGRS